MNRECSGGSRQHNCILSPIAEKRAKSRAREGRLAEFRGRDPAVHRTEGDPAPDPVGTRTRPRPSFEIKAD